MTEKERIENVAKRWESEGLVAIDPKTGDPVNRAGMPKLTPRQLRVIKERLYAFRRMQEGDKEPARKIGLIPPR